MFARLSRYTFTIDDAEKWRAANAVETEPETVQMVAELDGCRGVWFAGREEDAERTSGQAVTTVISLWDTREQAEAVREKTAARLLGLLGDWGVTLAGPPEAEILEVRAGRAV